MNNIIINIWAGIAILIFSYITWGALDDPNNKTLHKICIFIAMSNTGVLIACLLHLRTCLKDHADIYKKNDVIEKKIDRISGDLPH